MNLILKVYKWIVICLTKSNNIILIINYYHNSYIRNRIKKIYSWCWLNMREEKKKKQVVHEKSLTYSTKKIKSKYVI